MAVRDAEPFAPTGGPLADRADSTRKLPKQPRECLMSQTPLRVYYGPQEESPATNVSAARHVRRNVTVPLGEILPLLAEAIESERTWLRDFADDEITISMDLYEVILAYQHYRRPSA